MKLNRDISLLVIDSYFSKRIRFCDPMLASGIREIRFLKSIPEKFEKLFLGDISKTAIKNAKRNFRKNKVSAKNCRFFVQNAVNTINEEYFDFIEVDPFGSPVPFLDSALQRIKHNGILSVTATDTAALCGTYPKTSLRKYGMRCQMTLWFEELGLRNLIAYCQREAGKYDKSLEVLISYTNKHYYKVFFKVVEGRTKAYGDVRELKYLRVDKKSQDISVLDLEGKDSLGRTYVGKLCDKSFVEKLLENISLINDKKEVEKLLNALNDEINVIGHYNIHKLMKAYKIQKDIKFEVIIEELEKKGFKVSYPHNSKFCLKTDAKGKDLVKILKN